MTACIEKGQHPVISAFRFFFSIRNPLELVRLILLGSAWFPLSLREFKDEKEFEKMSWHVHCRVWHFSPGEKFSWDARTAFKDKTEVRIRCKILKSYARSPRTRKDFERFQKKDQDSWPPKLLLLSGSLCSKC